MDLSKQFSRLMIIASLLRAVILKRHMPRDTAC